MKHSLILLLAAIIFGCNGINPLKNVILKSPPHKTYMQSLEKAHLDKTVMAQEWIRAGEDAFRDSIIVTLPFSESGYFLASQPAARSYRFDARRGQVLTISGSQIAKSNSAMFLDLFVMKENNWSPLAHGDSTISLTYEFDSDVQCLVRLQPELLVTSYYSLSISLTPVLINPVAGATNKSVRSFYGDSRDGGKRKHEGVDIFAKKGTPVIAPTSGFITRVGTGKLGGKVIWLRDQKRGHSYYFAHLDDQFVKAGTNVKKGDTLGTVGNTGNARYTPPHLHFGIYQHTSFDPFHFIQTLEANAEATPWDTTIRQYDYKVIAKKIALKTGPGDNHGNFLELPKDSYLQVIAQTNDWYRVRLPDNRQGFVLKSKVAPIQRGKRLRLKDAATILSEANHYAVPLLRLTPAVNIEVLANFKNFKLVRTRDGVVGWLAI
jgi:peptidoglycan LD-endopeptidase LytH